MSKDKTIETFNDINEPTICPLMSRPNSNNQEDPYAFVFCIKRACMFYFKCRRSVEKGRREELAYQNMINNAY